MISFKSRKKLIISAAIAIAILILAALNTSAFEADGKTDYASILKFFSCFLLFTAVMFVDIKLPKIVQSIISVLLFILGPVLCFETVRALVGAKQYNEYIYFDNLIFYAVLQLAVFTLTQSVRISLLCEFAVSYLLHAANQIVLLVRGTPLVPTDLYAINTALTVTTPDDWHFDANLLIGTAGFALITAVVVKFRVTYPKMWVRAIAAIASLILTVGGVIYIWDIDYTSYSTSTFDTESTNNVNGVALSFYINFRKMKYDKPLNYDPAAIDEYLSQYENDTLEDDAELPNIIVIMNESFSDLSYMGRLKTDQPYMPYYNKLIKDHPHGRLLVSVLGGGTCNTEFEYLTGLSMMYTPNSCYTYMQHIRQDVPSMASYLKDYGYQAVAMHPFYEVCWKRNSVYDFMGFDDFVSGEDMTTAKSKYVSADRWEKGFGDDVEYVRTLISDSFFYDKVIEQFENKDSDRIFIFGVTVQNHSGYEYKGADFVSDVHITNYDGDYPRAEQYLSLVKKSDEALEELISYFEKVDEKTMIVFFGDHQPNVEIGFINKIAPYRNMIVNSFLTRYETPFVIWTNYEIESKNDLGIVSPNFLGLKTLEYAGVPLSRECKMLKDVEEIAPAMNTWGYFDRAITWNERRNEEPYRQDVLNVYNYYTYFNLHSKLGEDGRYARGG